MVYDIGEGKLDVSSRGLQGFNPWKEKKPNPLGFDMSYPHLQAGAFRALLSGPPFWVNSSMLSNGLQNRRLWGENPLHLPTIHDDCTGETMQSSYHTHDGLSSVWLLALLFHHHGVPPGELPWISRPRQFFIAQNACFYAWSDYVGKDVGKRGGISKYCSWNSDHYGGENWE